MTFSAPPPAKPSRYYENGCPTNCSYCGQRFEDSAIHDTKANRYFCSNACLETEEFVRFSVIPKKVS